MQAAPTSSLPVSPPVLMGAEGVGYGIGALGATALVVNRFSGGPVRGQLIAGGIAAAGIGIATLGRTARGERSPLGEAKHAINAGTDPLLPPDSARRSHAADALVYGGVALGATALLALNPRAGRQGVAKLAARAAADAPQEVARKLVKARRIALTGAATWMVSISNGLRNDRGVVDGVVDHATHKTRPLEE